MLKARWKQIGRGRFIGPKEEKVLMHDLLDALVLNYQQNGRRYTMPSETVVYPGHGPATKIGYERRTNPFVPGE